MPQCVFQLLCVIHCFGTLVNWVNIVDAMLPCHASNLSPFHTGRGRPSSRLRSLRGNRDYFDERLSQVQIRHSGLSRPFRAHSSGITNDVEAAQSRIIWRSSERSSFALTVERP